MHDIIIIGAGLSGLTASYELSKNNIKTTVLEARGRVGGRINTIEGPIEMGATWFSDQHSSVIDMLRELNINAFPQFTEGKISYELNAKSPIQYFDYPAGQAPSYRIQGGSIRLIKRLIEASPNTTVQLDTDIVSIEEIDDTLKVTTKKGITFIARQIILSLPPQLSATNIQFSPPLPTELMNLQKQTHTWMGESIKFGIHFKQPFWKENGLSGMGFSQSGVIQEMHDHCNPEQNFFALKGFLNPDLKRFSFKERETLVINTVVHLMGKQAKEYISYHDTIWAEEVFTSVLNSGYMAPHQNNGHPALSESLMNGKLIIAGSETASRYAGYMDGAISAGQRAASEVINGLHY